MPETTFSNRKLIHYGTGMSGFMSRSNDEEDKKEKGRKKAKENQVVKNGNIFDTETEMFFFYFIILIGSC